MDIAIIDDDALDRQVIKNYIQAFQLEEDHPLLQVVEFATAEELLWYQGNVDVLFMDIALGAVDGTKLAVEVRQKQWSQALIVFVSAYPDFVSQTYQAEAFGFLLKPVEKGRFFEQMRRCVLYFQDNQGTFVRSCFGKQIVINKNEVVYLEVHKRIIQAVLKDGSCVEYYGKISDECEALRSSHFVRCHRGLVVNLAYVKGFAANKEIVLTITQADGQPKRLPVSMKYRALVENAFLHYVALYR